MRKILSHYPISILGMIGILVLCLIPVPRIEVKVSFADKWTHMVMFFMLSGVLLFEYLRFFNQSYHTKLHSWDKLLFMFVFAALTELLQSVLTYRTGDWWDFAADVVGIFSAFLVFRGYVLLKK